MCSANIGWLFYRDYFKGLDYNELKHKSNENIIKERVDNIINQEPKLTEGVVLGNYHCKGTTTYPGLLLGAGNAHELPSLEGQAILGFHFDYTTGLPTIPGSSIKGVLRNAFAYPEYILSLLTENRSSINVKDLELEIFGQENGSIEICGGKDIFFDAEIIAGNKLMGDDYLTPHGDGLKEPIPLRFLKVLPGITFRFDFELHDGLLDKDEKFDLFKTILEDLGLGAKTNVGYGKFEQMTKYQTQNEQARNAMETERKAFIKATQNNDLELLQSFKLTYPKSEYIEEVEVKIDKCIFAQNKKEIEDKYENLTKNKQFLESFIKGNSQYDYAEETILKAKEALDNLKTGGSSQSVDIGELKNVKDAKKFKNIIASLNDISEDDKNIIEENAKRIYMGLKGNKQNKCFKEMQIGSCIDKDFEAKIKKDLGAK